MTRCSVREQMTRLLAGAAIASFVAYQQSRTFSKTPEAYGTGHYEGLIAPEAANNGVTAGTLIPLMVLGIPGGATASIMMVVIGTVATWARCRARYRRRAKTTRRLLA